jgi:hypothetical protein
MFGMGLCIAVASVLSLEGQEHARYREFQLGSNLASIVKLTGAFPSDAKTIHQRPAVMENLEWRPRRFSGGSQPDPVQQMVFSFYDDQLFRIVVEYDRNRTEGLTEADLVSAISETYGPSSKPMPTKNRGPEFPEEWNAALPLARWGDAEYSVTLLRRSYSATFMLAVAHTRLETLARTAEAEAVRLDAREAPQREVARQKQEAEDARAAQEKAKLVNKPAFRP